MTNIETAVDQTGYISAALRGNSSTMQSIGNIEADSNPVRMLAVGLAHAGNALTAVMKELEELRAEVQTLRAESHGRRTKR